MQKGLKPACLLTWTNCFYVSSSGDAVNTPRNPPQAGPPFGCSCSPCDAFKHEIDRLPSCPGADWQVDFLARLAFKGFQVRNSDGFHFNESAAVDRFDLENFSFGDDFTGFSIGSATDSRGCTE